MISAFEQGEGLSEMGILQTARTEAVRHAVGAILAIAPVSVFVVYFERTREYLTATLEPSELGTVLLLQSALFLLLMAWFVHLRVRLAGRKNPRDYRPHQPYPGVTVFMEKREDKSFQYQLWYCSRCLNVDNKLGVLQFNPLGGVATCERCKESISYSIRLPLV